MPPIPSPETISGYEKLGIIGILLLVLIAGMIVIAWAVKQMRSVATQFFGFVTEQTKALTAFKSAHEEQQETQVRMHERLDNLFSCTRPGCPIFSMRKSQQKDASRFSESPAATNAPQ